MSTLQNPLKSRVWSYSSVHQYEDCPRSFYLQRIKAVPQVNNAFALYGSFMHEILEQYFKGRISLPEMKELYLTDYEARVNIPFPPNNWVNLSESYYQDGLQFLENFSGIDPKYRVVNVEQKVNLEIGGYRTIGYIDLLLENVNNGELTIVDHKSKKKFSTVREEVNYRKQLLFYGIYVKHIYGKYPAYVDFNMFRSQRHVCTPFKEAECEQVRDWFLRTIETACQDETFQDKIERNCYESFKSIANFQHDDFFCNEICGSRQSCPRSSAYKKPRQKRAGKKRKG